jgi:hypothetical protein
MHYGICDIMSEVELTSHTRVTLKIMRMSCASYAGSYAQLMTNTALVTHQVTRIAVPGVCATSPPRFDFKGCMQVSEAERERCLPKVMLVQHRSYKNHSGHL